MNIEQIQEMWEKDSVIDENQLGEHATESPQLHAKYIRLLTTAKLKRTKLNSDLNQLKRLKFRYYRGELSREELTDLGWNQWQGVKPIKTEMEQLLEGDAEVNALVVKIEYLDTMLYLLESILNQIKSRDWQLRTHLDWKKFLAGN